DYAAKTLDQRREIVGLQPKRADVILAGACIVKAVLELTGAKELTVSDRSLRHGLMYELFKK
ncbi:MAG: Ppx/GppA family phosphatase, partial [Pyramidobacter sp.]|nr:Ppx/GppA family phosphatase [Pyramidobacter sp.]